MSDLHDPPSAAELVRAVREFLESDVLGSTEGRVQFHVRVAINVLAMVEREMELGPGQRPEHRARLRALGFGDDTELAEAIRDGTADPSKIMNVVRQAVRAKLEVANPGYLAEEDPQA